MSTELPMAPDEQHFSTGARRGSVEGKSALDLISPFALIRLGHHLRRGADAYDSRNWEKGIPVTRTIGSLLRHVMAYMAGETDEDHLAAIMCNSMFLLHYDEMIRRGVLSVDLDDRPDYHSPHEQKKEGE
jgi:hypothetical protein